MAVEKSPGALRRFLFGEQRSFNPWGAYGWMNPGSDAFGWMNYGSTAYPLMPTTMPGVKQEEPMASFEGFAHMAYKANGIVFACNQARMRLFSEARFQFRQLRGGRPGDLFGNADLAILENPWPNGTTRDLLKRAIQDIDISGNFYAHRQRDQIRRMRPDWVSIVLGSNMEPEEPAFALDAEVVGYMYHPGGYRSGLDPIALLPEEVCHFAPIPDPYARFRGMTWLTPIIREFMADNAMSDHKLKFFENGATVNLALKYPEGMSSDLFKSYVDLFRQRHGGVANAYNTLHLGGGATPVAVGSNMEQLDFKVVQSAGEVRICAAAGVPPICVGVTSGLEAATYSNYGQARRAFADGTMRDLWGHVSGALGTIVRIPGGSELWYDDRNISFLQEDQKDAAEIQKTQTTSINTLIIAGYEPQSAIDAVLASDFSRLKHMGLFSVQLQAAGQAMSAKAQTIHQLISAGFEPDSAVNAVINDDFALLEHTGQLHVLLQPTSGTIGEGKGATVQGVAEPSSNGSPA